MSAREPEDRLDCEVLGYRQWKVNADLRLASAVAPTVWEPGVNEARCEDINTVRLLRAMGHYDVARPEPRHDAPHHECHCGFYALHKPTFWYDDDGGDPSLSRGSLSMGGDQAVAGLVAGWGRVEVHHEGFRSQFARVVAIATPKDKRGAILARAVADEYGVPCVPRDELERVAGEFGSPVPEDMRPELPKLEVADAAWPPYGQGANFYSPVATSGYARGANFGATVAHYPAGSGNHAHPSSYSIHPHHPHANARSSLVLSAEHKAERDRDASASLLSYMPWWWFVLVGMYACGLLASTIVIAA